MPINLCSYQGYDFLSEHNVQNFLHIIMVGNFVLDRIAVLGDRLYLKSLTGGQSLLPDCRSSDPAPFGSWERR